MSEDLELLKLRAKAKAKAEREREDTPTETAPEYSSYGETTMAALAETVPGGKQIGSAINATLSTMSGDDETGSWGEEYNKALDSVNESVDRSASANPKTFGTVDLGSQMAMAAAAGPSIIAQGALAGVNAFSRSRDEGKERLKSTLGATAIGGVLTYLTGPVLQKGIAKAGQSLRKLSERTTLSAVQPGESKKFLKETHNLITHRYKGDVPTAARHADEIIGLDFVKNTEGVARNATNAKNEIGGQIFDLIDEIDDAAMIIKGGGKTKNGGILGAELKHAIGGKSRFATDLPPVLRPNFSEIDNFIDDIVITKKVNKEIVYNRMEAPDGLTGGKKVWYEAAPSGKEELIAREFTPKEIFKIKVNIANKVEDVFQKALEGKTPTPSQIASMKSQQARVVGKLADVLDSEVAAVSAAGMDDVTGANVKVLRELNKKYAMANHLERVSYDTLATQSSSAFQLTRDLVSWKGIAVAGAVGVNTGSATASIGILLGSAVLKNPSTPIKAARGLSKLSSFLQQKPGHPYAQEIALAIRNASNPDQLQKDLGGFIAGFNLLNSAVARTPESVRMNENNISAYVRLRQGDEAAKSFKKALKDEATLGAFMDTFSKTEDTEGMVEEGLGWGGKVYNDGDKSMLSDQLMGNSDVSLSQRLQHRKALMADGTIPQVQPDSQPPYRHIPRRKDRHEY